MNSSVYAMEEIKETKKQTTWLFYLQKEPSKYTFPLSNRHCKMNFILPTLSSLIMILPTFVL